MSHDLGKPVGNSALACAGWTNIIRCEPGLVSGYGLHHRCRRRVTPFQKKNRSGEGTLATRQQPPRGLHNQVATPGPRMRRGRPKSGPGPTLPSLNIAVKKLLNESICSQFVHKPDFSTPVNPGIMERFWPCISRTPGVILNNRHITKHLLIFSASEAEVRPLIPVLTPPSWPDLASPEGSHLPIDAPPHQPLQFGVSTESLHHP